MEREREIVIRRLTDRDAVLVSCTCCTWGLALSPALSEATSHLRQHYCFGRELSECSTSAMYRAQLRLSRIAGAEWMALILALERLIA